MRRALPTCENRPLVRGVSARWIDSDRAIWSPWTDADCITGAQHDGGPTSRTAAMVGRSHNEEIDEEAAALER